MALTTCSECKGPLSTTADRCPHCGHRRSNLEAGLRSLSNGLTAVHTAVRKTMLVVFGLILFLALLLYVFRGREGTSDSPSGAPTPAPVATTPAPVAPVSGGAAAGVKPEERTPPDVAGVPQDAELTRSGLAFRRLRRGFGDFHPGPQDTVEINYTGWTADGRMFASTHGKPVRLPLNGVVKGLTEGLQLMSIGEKRRFWIPAELAYANQIGKPAGMLVMDVELKNVSLKDSMEREGFR